MSKRKLLLKAAYSLRAVLEGGLVGILAFFAVPVIVAICSVLWVINTVHSIWASDGSPDDAVDD